MDANQIKEQNEKLQAWAEAFEKRHKGKTVIADYYQLGRFDGKRFDLENKKLIRGNVPVEASHLVTVNLQWANSGKLYECNEVATEKWRKELAKDISNRSKADELKKNAGEALVTAIDSIKKTNEAKASAKVEEPVETKDPKEALSQTAIDLVIEDFAKQNERPVEFVKQQYSEDEAFKVFINEKASAL